MIDATNFNPTFAGNNSQSNVYMHVAEANFEHSNYLNN